jgi:YCII-related domain
LRAANYFGAHWMHPMRGLSGEGLVTRWSWELLMATSRVLLNRQAPDAVRQDPPGDRRERQPAPDGTPAARSRQHLVSFGCAAGRFRAGPIDQEISAPTDGETTMRFMIMVKASQDSEAGQLPSQALLAAMGNYNEALVKAGVLLSGDGLQPSSKGARVRFSGDRRTVIDVTCSPI